MTALDPTARIPASPAPPRRRKAAAYLALTKAARRFDPETGKDVSAELASSARAPMPFTAKAKGSATLTFTVKENSPPRAERIS